MSDVNVMEQQPAGGNPMRPSSGTYGERAAEDRLRSQLPAAKKAAAKKAPAAVAPSPAGPPSPPMRGSGMGGSTAPAGMPASAAPAGLPSALLAPTSRPDVPIATALNSGATDMFPAAVDARQRRLALLDMLTTHPDASPDVREWAQVVRSKLIGE